MSAEEIADAYADVADELTGTGLWSPSRGIPLFVAILVGYALVVAWMRRRDHDRTAQQRNHLTNSLSV